MFSGLKQKLGQGRIADTAARGLNLVSPAKQDGHVRSPVTPNSEKRSSSGLAPNDLLVDVGLNPSDSDIGFTGTPRTDGQSGAPLAARSRTSSISSQASDASFFTPQPSSVGGQLSFTPMDDQVSVSEAETDEQSAVFASTTKEELYQLYSKTQRRGQQYKWKYLQLLAGYKDSEEERKKLEKTLTQTQDKTTRRIAELREQSQLDKQAKADLENNYQLMLDEKDEMIQVLRTQVNLLKDGKDIPPELMSKIERSHSLTEQPTSPMDASGSSFGPDESALREKVKRLETLLTKCKETIKANKDRTQQLVAEKESLQKQLESVQKGLDSKTKELESSKIQHEEAVTKYQGQLKQAKQLIVDLETDKTMAVAAAKQELHAALESKDEELTKIRDRVRNVEVENESLKQKVVELQSAGQERVDKAKQTIRRLTEEKQQLEEESKQKLENSERNLEQVRANELQELRRGKVEALQVLQKQMDDKIQTLLVEKEADLDERDKQWQEKWKQREAAKESELQARLADRLADMELAVEDQQLQKTAALKLQEVASQDLQIKIRELTETNHDLTLKLTNLQQEFSDRTKDHQQQIEDIASRNSDRLREMSAQHESGMAEAMQEWSLRQERLLDETRAEFSVKNAELQRVHEEQLQHAVVTLESTYTSVISELKLSHGAALDDYRSQISQLQREVAEAHHRVSSTTGEAEQSQNTWRDRETELTAQLAEIREVNTGLERQIGEFAERENQLNIELEETKVDRERRIAAQNEAMQQLRSEIDALTISEARQRSLLEDTTRRLNEQVDEMRNESSEAINGLSGMLQSNQMELMSIISELDSAQRQLAETVVHLDERSAELSECQAKLSKAQNDATQSERQLQLTIVELESQCCLLREKVTSYEHIVTGNSSVEELVQRISELESRLIEKDRAIMEFEQRVQEFGDQISKETASVHERSRQVESLLLDNSRLLREKEAIANEQTEKISELEGKIAGLKAAQSSIKIDVCGSEPRFSNSDAFDGIAVQHATSGGNFLEERTKLEQEIKMLRQHLDQANDDMKCFKESVRKQFEERKQKVKLTVERMKAGFEETLREKDELHERNIRSLQEEKDREKAEAVKDLTERVAALTSDRDIAIAEALASQNEEIDYLKADLASIKVRLRDTLSQSQAEKDALLRHADAGREDLLQRLDKVRRESSPGAECTVDNESAADDHSSLAQSVEGTSSEGNDSKLQTERLQCSVNEVEDLKQQLATKTASLEDTRIKLNSLESRLEESQTTFAAKISELTSALSEQEAELRQRQERIQQLNEELELARSAEQQIKENRERDTDRADSEKTLLQSELSSLREQLTAKSACLNSKESEIINISNSSKSLEEELKCMQLTVTIMKEEKEKAMNDAEAKLNLALTELDSMKAELTAKSVDLDAKAAEVLQISDLLKIAEEQNLKNINELGNRDSEIKRCHEELVASKSQFEEKLTELERGIEAKLESERSLFRALLDERTLELDARSTQLNELEVKIRDRDFELDSTKERLNAEISDLRQQVNNFEEDCKVFKEQSDSGSSELENQLIRIRELESETRQLKDSFDAKSGELENSNKALPLLQDELSAAKESLDNKCTALQNKNEAELQELHARQRLEMEDKLNELAAVNLRIASLENTIQELQQTAVTEKERLLSDVQQKDCEIQLLITKRDQEIADLKACFDLKMNEVQAEQNALAETNSSKITQLESLNRSLNQQLESAVSSGTAEEKFTEDLRIQMESRNHELEELQLQLTKQILEKDTEIGVLNQSLAESGRGLQLLQNTVKRFAAHNGSAGDIDAQLLDSASDCSLSETVNQIERFAAENTSLRKRVDDLMEDLKRASFVANSADSEETIASSSMLQTGASFESDSLALSQAHRSEIAVSQNGPNAESTEQYKAHVDQLNAIIEDLQQRLLDQEMEVVSCKAETSITSAASTELSAMTADQLRSQVTELSRQLEESNWLHSLEINEIRDRQDASFAASPRAQKDEAGRLASEVSRLRTRERELLREIDLVRCSNHVPSSNSSDNVYAVFGPLLAEPTEIEYLRNILYQYMLGTETKTLAKVICKVMKFSEEQTRHVVDRATKNEPWLSPAHH